MSKQKIKRIRRQAIIDVLGFELLLLVSNGMFFIGYYIKEVSMEEKNNRPNAFQWFTLGFSTAVLIFNSVVIIAKVIMK